MRKEKRVKKNISESEHRKKRGNKKDPEVNEKKNEGKQKEMKASIQKIVRSRVFFYTNKSMFVLLYNKALLNINELDYTLPNMFSSLL